MNLSTAALAVAGALALSGCGQSGVSVGVEQSASTEVGSKSDVSASKTVSGGKSAKASTVVPGAQLVAAALRPVVALAGIDIDAYAHNIKYLGSEILPVERYLAAKHAYGQGATAVQAQAARDQARFRAVPASEVTARYAADLLGVCADLAATGDQGAYACYSEAYTRIFAAAAVLATSSPQLLPGLPGEVVDGFDKSRKFDSKSLATWLGGSVALVDMSLELQPSWLQGIVGQVLRDQDAAELHVVRALFATPVDEIRRLAGRPQGLTARVTPGEAGSPLKLTVPERNWVLIQDEKGLTLVLNGSTYHGDGQLQGGKMEIALETSASATDEKKISRGTDAAAKENSSGKFGANLQ